LGNGLVDDWVAGPTLSKGVGRQQRRDGNDQWLHEQFASPEEEDEGGRNYGQRGSRVNPQLHGPRWLRGRLPWGRGPDSKFTR